MFRFTIHWFTIHWKQWSCSYSENYIYEKLYDERTILKKNLIINRSKNSFVGLLKLLWNWKRLLECIKPLAVLFIMLEIIPQKCFDCLTNLFSDLYLTKFLDFLELLLPCN